MVEASRTAGRGGERESEAGTPGLVPSRRRLLVQLWCCWTAWQIVALAWRVGARIRMGDGPVQVGEPVRIDLNRARIGELSLLPGIGRTRAEAIVLHRVRHGPYRSVEALAEVDGIGARTVADLAPFVEV